MSTSEATYEIYAIDPNGDGHLLGETDHRNGEGGAIDLWIQFTREYKGSGGSVEIWRDGEPVNERSSSMIEDKESNMDKAKDMEIGEITAIGSTLTQGGHLIRESDDVWLYAESAFATEYRLTAEEADEILAQL